MRATIDLTVEEMKELQKPPENREEPDLMTLQDLERALLTMADKNKDIFLKILKDGEPKG